MNRCKFYTVVDVDGVNENDVLHNNLSRFRARYATALYRVEASDIQRPDLISHKAYGTVRYWWVVLSYNNIQNPFTDIEIGDILELPHALDIHEFFKRYAVR